ncbi:MAG: MCE family protein [Gammaproteobacteria bacterium]|nr:MAG: MCE family protein [Gammaproteobacteria bacterium]
MRVKRDNVNYVLVGAVVAASFIALLVALSIITGRSGASSSYIAHYRNVTGLRYGAPVFYEGYRVGQVAAIDPERDIGAAAAPAPAATVTDKSGLERKGTRYKVTLAVRRDWPIPKDSVARMISSGLLADVAIGISEGASREIVAPGSELAAMENADLFASMNDLAQQLGDLTRNQIGPLVKNLASHVDSIATALDKNTPEILAQSHALLQRLNIASDSVNDVIKPQNRAAIGAILGNVRDLSRDLKATQNQLNEAIVRIDSVVRENRPGVRNSVDDLRGVMAALSGRIDSISQHLEVAARNFDEFAREVRMNPNRLLIAPKGDKVEQEPK